MESDKAPPTPARAARSKAAGRSTAEKKDAPPPDRSETESGYQVSLPMFEGPLDLLLHLVQKHELDILNIPIAFITEKYTAYIQLLDELNIDLASEYLVMAATLVHIKSRMLLPNPPADELADGSEDAELDPRAELVRRLLEYQKYKLAAEQLGLRPVLGRDVFPRGSSDQAAGGEAPLEGVSMFKLLDAFQSVLTRTQNTRDHQIDFDRFSISEKISELSDRLRLVRRLIFHEIFDANTSRGEIIITFLAILEMTRLRLTRLSQDGPFLPIYIELRVTDDAAPEALFADTQAAADDSPETSGEADAASDKSLETSDEQATHE
jgi:segregation and condensation protein A